MGWNKYKELEHRIDTLEMRLENVCQAILQYCDRMQTPLFEPIDYFSPYYTGDSKLIQKGDVKNGRKDND